VLGHEYISIGIFALIALSFPVVTFFIGRFFRPNNANALKNSTYECGEIPEGSAWVKFNIRFYIIALVFIIFDVEVVFLFPWAAVYQDFILSGNGVLVLFEMLMFVIILLIGFAYVWIKGDLDWVKMKLKYGAGRYANLKMEKK